MTIKDVKYNKSFQKDNKLSKLLNQFEDLINELKKKKLPENLVLLINFKIEEINSIDDSKKRLKNKIKKNQSKIIQQVEKESKIVPKNHYRNTWLAIGMAAFGISGDCIRNEYGKYGLYRYRITNRNGNWNSYRN